MKTVFADAGYWFALINPHDGLRPKATAVSKRLGRCRIVTTEMVLTEVLNHFADKGQQLRKNALDVVKKLRSDPNLTIQPQTHEQFSRALARYEQRPDKKWSLTDCASFLAMDEEEIRDALAHDEHFQQAGFRALLRED
jgi:predicted nucleic acid-binding protein